MYTGKIDSWLISFTQVYVQILIIILLAFSATSCLPLENKPEATINETPFADDIVEEVSSVIVDFETLWLSEQSHRDPTFQAELATGKYLDFWGYARSNIHDEPIWFVTDSAKLESIKLIEYKDDRFKAKACVIKNGRKIRPDGTLIEVLSPPNTGLCGIYVFIKAVDKWKLLGYINTTDPRTYEHAPDWLKEIIGEIPIEL